MPGACTPSSKAAQAWAEERFKAEIAPIEAPVLGEDGQPTGETRLVDRDQGLARDLDRGARGAQASPRRRPAHRGHLVADLRRRGRDHVDVGRRRPPRSALRPRARIVSQALIGDDPYYHLNGPVAATTRVLERAGMTIGDIDLFEVNEAFAAVVVNWARQHKVDVDKVNVNGGAIALGHPVGSTGSRLITTALHELERTGGTTALISMCAGGALATGTIIERL